jgi:hypothetical protein
VPRGMPVSARGVDARHGSPPTDTLVIASVGEDPLTAAVEVLPAGALASTGAEPPYAHHDRVAVQRRGDALTGVQAAHPHVQ